MLIKINSRLQEAKEVNEAISNSDIPNTIEVVAKAIVSTLKNGGRVLTCGNGGSAADALHIATELSGRFYQDRAPLDVQSLVTNTPNITAIGNDFGFEEIFSRMVTAIGRPGDVLFALSTSGNSPNVINALQAARNKEMITIGFSGMNGGKMNDSCDHIIKIPSEDTPRIQEAHILLGHIVCELVEEEMFKANING